MGIMQLKSKVLRKSKANLSLKNNSEKMEGGNCKIMTLPILPTTRNRIDIPEFP